MRKYSKVADMYWILYELKIKYDTIETKLLLEEYFYIELEKIKSKALEWLADDERDSQVDNEF